MATGSRRFNGFRFVLRYPSNDEETAMSDMVVLVVAGLQDDAVALARAKCPRPCTTALIGSGPAVLEEAKARGIGESQALVLQ